MSTEVFIQDDRDNTASLITYPIQEQLVHFSNDNPNFPEYLVGFQSTDVTHVYYICDDPQHPFSKYVPIYSHNQSEAKPLQVGEEYSCTMSTSDPDSFVSVTIRRVK